MEIQIKNLCKTYNGQKVLDNFCGKFPEGVTTCIMAPSGKGKTTLFRILLNLEKADSGEIKGLESSQIRAVFQEDRLCENLTAEANIRLVQQRKKGKSQEFIQKVEEGLQAVGLKGCGKRPVKELSGGMKRRVALLRALYADWDVLLLDEPFKGLDKETRDRAVDFVRETCKGKTVVCVTHEREEAEALGANIIEL